jgi:hypothetical protein
MIESTNREKKANGKERKSKMKIDTESFGLSKGRN